jgi:hypothetical protein
VVGLHPPARRRRATAPAAGAAGNSTVHKSGSAGTARM